VTTTTFQQNVGGYTGTVDTTIRGSRPDKSYATTTRIDVDGLDKSNKEIQGLLQFSNIFGTGQGQIAYGAIITSATLTLNVGNGTKDQVSLYRMAQDWASMPNLTWNGFGDGVQANGTEAMATPDVVLQRLDKGVDAIDVTQSLQAWSDGRNDFGWLVHGAGADGFQFSSSETALAPILTVTYELPTAPVPGITVVESDGSNVVTEGGAGDSFTVVLDKAPTSNVTVTVATDGGTDVTIAPIQLTFTPQNWQIAQSVNISAINDAIVEMTENFIVSLSATSGDTAYNGLSHNTTVSVIDNDTSNVPLTPFLVAVHDTTQYKAGDPTGYGSGDPSGLAYIPGLDMLFIADSEHNESPYFSTVNLFATRLDGTFVQSISMMNFTHEPTGLAYNPHNGLLYVSDDDQRKIFIVDPLDPTVSLGQINVGQYGIVDAEDPVIDPVTGHIYMLSGVQRSLFELSATGDLLSTKPLPSAILDPEAFAYDAQHDVFYIAGGATRGTIFQTDRDGTILQSFDLLNSYRHEVTGGKPKIKGLEIAPSSDPHDGNHMSLYAADYGIDQVPDGRVFEIDLYHEWVVA
jgi:hypothetical protein